MGSKKKLFKKWFLRFKNQDLEAEFQSQRSKSSYNKFKRFNILVTSSHIVLLIILYFGGHLEGKEYRRNQEDSACKIRNEYRFLTVFPALIGVLQLDTILMKFKILQWMRGTLTLLTFFICTTEMSIHKFDNIKGMCIEFGQFTYLLMLTIYVGKEIIKYWERATITFILGVIYLYLRYINLDKAVYPQLILIVPILLLIMGFLYYNFEESERRLFYLMYEADKKEKEWSKLFNKMLVGLIIRNKQRKIKYTNRIAKQLIGEDVISNELGNRGEVLKNFIEEIDGKWKKRLRNADNIEHEICLSREGRIIYLEINKMSFELDNQKCRVYILKDMTLGKQVQIDMSKHAEEKDLFFASMSHDLRNPLNALLGSIDIFKISNYEYDQEIIETAQTCGETLLTIIGNILDVSKIENKKLDICPSGGNIVECVMKVALMMRSLAEKKSLFLKFKPELNMHKFYFFDHTRLTQVLINLIGNAIKFTDKGGIKIHLNWYPQQQLLTDDQISLNLEQIHQNDYQNFIETIVYDGGNITEGIEDRNIMNEQTAEPVTMQDLNSRFSTEIIRPERKDENEEIMQQILEDNSEIEEECKILSKENILDQRGFIKIQITDSGIGISSSEIEKLFNPFSQAENSRRKFGGTGLGLWISDNIIKKMGGSLKVVSEEKIGSSFIIAIPLEQYNYIQHIEKSNIFSDIFRDSRILLVEDDDPNRKIMGELLERSGCSVYLANNGKTAFEIFKDISEESAPNKYFSAILTDLRMPVMSGQIMIMKIRKYEKLMHLEKKTNYCHIWRSLRERESKMFRSLRSQQICQQTCHFVYD